MRKNALILLIIFIFGITGSILAQEPPHPPHPPKVDKNWSKRLDANKDGAIDPAEFRADSAKLFDEFDRNKDGVIDETEIMPSRPQNEFGEKTNRRQPPIFRTADKDNDGKITRAEFDEDAPARFNSFDKNKDALITPDEADQKHGEHPEKRRNPPDSPMAAFLSAEIRFGDKLVKNAPFSAETVMENTRRLFDGTTVTKQSKGAIYRDGAGRTRREQTLESIGSFSIGEAQKLIFINDVVEKSQYFLNPNLKLFRKLEMRENSSEDLKFRQENGEGKTESLGTKTINGINAEGTRTVIEIPVGQIGNDKPVQVVSERWYSPELQMVIMSRHVDPLSGEQVFRLENVKLGEPDNYLFKVPADFKPEKDERRNDAKRDGKIEGKRPEGRPDRRPDGRGFGKPGRGGGRP